MDETDMWWNGSLSYYLDVCLQIDLKTKMKENKTKIKMPDARFVNLGCWKS